MIPEERQDQAVLYVLGGLEGSELAAFETAMKSGDAELRNLVGDLRESAAAIALTAADRRPSAGLKSRILREIAIEKFAGASRGGAMSWLPWSIAAFFMIFSGVLFYERAQMRQELNEAETRDPFAQMNVVVLAPQKGAPPEAKAVVAWQVAAQSGIIRVSGLQPIAGKDYQLWAIDAAHKDPVSAGILRVDANGIARVRFAPVVATSQVKAFAISLEGEGGGSKPEGPILLVGSTT